MTDKTVNIELDVDILTVAKLQKRGALEKVVNDAIEKNLAKGFVKPNFSPKGFVKPRREKKQDT